MIGGIRRLGSTSALFVAALVAFTAPARGAEFETRTYLDMSLVRSLAPETAPALRLGPFVREESRFREQGLVYLKMFAGARVGLLPWLRAAVYYSHKDKLATGHVQSHLAVLDLYPYLDLGPIRLVDKSGFEMHVTDGFFRYRNALKLRWQTPVPWLAPFVSGELRVDSDASRVNQYDITAGFELRPESMLAMKIFYGYEGKHRGKPDWVGTHMIGFAIAARL